MAATFSFPSLVGVMVTTSNFFFYSRLDSFISRKKIIYLAHLKNIKKNFFEIFFKRNRPLRCEQKKSGKKFTTLRTPRI
jgi:hypothetical protein